jgi:hypothetical protein
MNIEHFFYYAFNVQPSFMLSNGNYHNALYNTPIYLFVSIKKLCFTL